MDDVLRLFPTPFMRARQTLEAELVAASSWGTDFAFKSDHRGMAPNEFCADK